MNDGLRRLVTSPLTIRASQIVIGVVFAWAALAKIGDLDGFAEQVQNFRMLPLALVNVVAMLLPWVELVAALALILGVRPRAGALLATAMMLLFTVAVGVALGRGLDIECGCFGTSDGSRVGAVKIVQNLGLLAVAALATLRPRWGGSAG